PVQLFLIAFVVTLAAALVRAPVSTVLAAAAAVVSGFTVAGTLLTDAPAVRPNGDRIGVGHLNAQSRSIDVDALGAYLERTKPDVFVILDPLQPDVPQFR